MQFVSIVLCILDNYLNENNKKFSSRKDVNVAHLFQIERSQLSFYVGKLGTIESHVVILFRKIIYYETQLKQPKY